MRRFALFALPLMLAACGEAGDEAAPLSDDEIDAANPLADASLDLQGTGIVIPAQAGFEELAVPFGSGRIPTEATLGNVLGEAIDESADPNDCGLTWTTYEGVTLSFRDDAFAGYFAEPPYTDIGTRAELLAGENVALYDESTLGEEFTIGAAETPVISGLFSGPEDDAAVIALWAGENCIAR
ncbi:hypothetical protein [Aurantiacibacter gilvus]|uniref:Aspartate-semialdehyde dehydrogenase n=1 Tax=Aurantiacibacter gilvus TaxID=3139141 RepID=A0ABU9IDN4_9SPHN